jgi:hypothetical protein
MPISTATGSSPAYRPTMRRQDADALGGILGASKRRCPDCDGPLTQTPRRLVDRAMSVFVSMHRYRCPNFLCTFEGNLRDRPLGTKEVLNSLGLSSAIERDRR